MKIKIQVLFKYKLMIPIPIVNVKKLMRSLFIKKMYVLHYEKLLKNVEYNTQK